MSQHARYKALKVSPDWPPNFRNREQQFISGRQVLRSARAVAKPIDEQGDHGLSMVGSAIVCAPAQTRDRVQKIPGGEIGADFAGGYRGREKCLKRRFESLPEVRGQRGEGRVSRMQGGGQPAFGPEKGGVSLHPSRQGFAGPVPGCQDRRGVRAGIDFATEDGRYEVWALREVAIKGPDSDTGLQGDLSHRSVDSRGREHFDGRLEQRVDAALRVDAHLPIPAPPRLHTLSLVFRFVAHHISLDNRNVVPYLTNTDGTQFRIIQYKGDCYA